MFNALPEIPRDPIVGLMSEVALDLNPKKIDLGAGVYRNEDGATPILDVVRLAEAKLLDLSNTKTYGKQTGPIGALQAIQELILDKVFDDVSERLAGTITPGGTGAVRLGAELIKRSNSNPTVWLSSPGWPNHAQIFGSLGYDVKYYNFINQVANTGTFIQSISQAKSDDVIVLHGCCHNPSGNDLSLNEWRQLADLAKEKKLLPFIDLAYQGFGESLSFDVEGLNLLASKVDSLIIASSCSKNFGLYRDRVGALSVLLPKDQLDQIQLVQDNINNVTRTLYSFPPAHGAMIVKEILTDENLRDLWQVELDSCVKRIQDIKYKLITHIEAASSGDIDISYITSQKGMFCLLDLTEAEVLKLKQDYNIYMTLEGRINVSGLNKSNIERFANALLNILNNRC